MQFISTVVGNYPKTPDAPKPQKLRQALHKFDRGEISKKDLEEVEQEVIIEVVNEQLDAGLDLISDGQIRWDDGQTYLAQRIRGFSINGLRRYFDTNMYYRQPVVEKQLERIGSILLDDYKFVKVLNPAPVKVVITGPYTLAKLSKDNFYNDFETLVLKLAEILNQEAKSLEKEEPALIQFDEPAIVHFKGDFEIFRKAADLLTQDLIAETALYTYFGAVDGLYPKILELPFDVVGLDFIQGKKNWEMLEKAPFSKKLGFGIIDARNTKLEDIDTLVTQIKRVATLAKTTTIYVNPSCGLEFLPRNIAFKKLNIMAQAVEKVKEELA